jgi:hypothetical protein
MKILHVEITTWAGMSIGATHYYGKIEFPYDDHKDSIELNFILTKRDVILLNKKERMYAPTFRTKYIIGEPSSRFDTKEEIERAGIKYYEENLKKEYSLLVLGGKGVIEPQKIIAYNCKSSSQIKLIEKINKIAEQYDYDDDCDTDHNEALNKKWKPLWKQLTREV